MKIDFFDIECSDVKMGQRASRQTKAEKEHKEQIKQLATDAKKQELLRLKSHILMHENTLTDSSGKVLSSKELTSLLNVTQNASLQSTRNTPSLFLIDTAIQQLDRNSSTLVKADLIAIIISLKPEYLKMINELQTKFTVLDLNSLIRNIIYDPSFILRTGSQQNVQICSQDRELPVSKTKELDCIKEETVYDIIQS